MTETSTTRDAKAGGAERAARIGRRLGAGLFWLMAIYIVGASTASIVGQVYGRPGGPPLGTPSETACAQRLSTLTSTLATLPGAAMAAEHDAAATALDNWDQQMQDLEGHCGRLESTREALAGVRAQLGNLVDTLATRERPELARITRRLEPFVAGTVDTDR